MKHVSRWLLIAALALVPVSLAYGQTMPGGGGGGSSTAPCSAFGTTVGTCLQGASALGTPTSGTATNLTGLPISTGVSGLGTGVATALGTNVGTAGAPVVNGGALGTPSSGTATNLTGLPISTGVAGLGTGVATALGTNVGSAGAPVVNGGALGTPSSGTGTNLTGTAAGLTAGTVTTNANLTGPITSTGNATSIASQTGTGSKFVVDTNPTIVQPVFSGSIIASIRTTTVSPVTVSATTDYFICVNTTSGATTVNLPGSPTTGLQYVVKDCKGNAGTNNITVTPAAGNIDGSATYVMSTNYQGATFVYSGSQWFVF